MAGTDKLLEPLGGVPVIVRAMSVFSNLAEVCCVVVVCGADRSQSISDAVASLVGDAKICWAEGGERRQDSVRQGLTALDSMGCAADMVAIHDGARPLAESTLLAEGLSVARVLGAAVPVVPVTDSVKRVENGLVSGSVDRSSLFATQTPQVFKREVIAAAHDSIESDVTDDAAMVEQAGGLVATFPGVASNIKITTPSDLVVANAILSSKSGRAEPTVEFRHGIGYDVHKLAPGGQLRLGGIELEFAQHLEGHSDGDVLMHAVASAILGASGLGDMGKHFPSDDLRYAGIDSRYFVTESVTLASDSGWNVDYVDAIVIAAAPRISPHYAAMVQQIAAAASLPLAKVNLKSTSTDGVGGIGSGEGIGAQAVATVSRS